MHDCANAFSLPPSPSLTHTRTCTHASEQRSLRACFRIDVSWQRPIITSTSGNICASQICCFRWSCDHFIRFFGLGGRGRDGAGGDAGEGEAGNLRGFSRVALATVIAGHNLSQWTERNPERVATKSTEISWQAFKDRFVVHFDHLPWDKVYGQLALKYAYWLAANKKKSMHIAMYMYLVQYLHLTEQCQLTRQR